MKGHHNDIQEGSKVQKICPAAAQNISYMPDSSFASGNAVNPTGDTLREVEKIPLPNEKDETAFDAMPAAGSRSPSMFFRKLHSDEIILLFLIFILIAEGIDDDFLLIVLIYLLVSEIFEEYFRLQNKSV